MTSPTPPPTDYDPLMDSPVTRVKIATPWWTRSSAAVLAVALAVALLVGAISQWQGVNNERQNARFARAIADRNLAATETARAESECRSARNTALTRTSSELVGLTAELFVLLSQRDPTLSDPTNPIYARFDALAKQRDADDAAADRAVTECRVG